MDSLVQGLKDLSITTQNSSYNSKRSNNYQTTSLYPNKSELVHPKDYKQLNLPQNITKGPYESTLQYFQTHFTLLRADFIKPIREDLLKFFSDPNQRFFNIKIHEVQFTRKGVKDNDICYCVEIKKGLTDSSWNLKRNPKRFMNGTLLIFTVNNFNTIFCGRVADNSNLINRKVLVSFEQPTVLKYEKTYYMIECCSFFEPYYQILKVIQRIDLKKFPMTKYLVEADNKVARPKYLRNIKYNIKDTELNPSQLIAINGAMNQELVIIQGPPGTGKTFLGLKIAKTLLNISHNWYYKSPMLVISFTNHALDQFLECLIEPAQDQILRLGGQSKNSKMKNYTLTECRRRFYNSSISHLDLKLRIAPLYHEFRTISNEITNIERQMDNISTSNPTCILYFDLMSEGVPEIDRWFSKRERSRMVAWLLEDDGTMDGSDHGLNDAELALSLYEDVLKEAHGKSSKYCLLSVSYMETAAVKLYNRIDQMHKDFEATKMQYRGHCPNNMKQKKREVEALIKVYDYLVKKTEYFKVCLAKDFNNELESQHLNSINPFKMPVRVRWQLYQSWLAQYERYMRMKMDKLIEKYLPAYENFKEIADENQLEIMRNQKIIGMTTTKAAQMHEVIKKLECPIVIVEEAAEVLEAHIMPVLTEHCQHLILIGDHKQLKPTTADYDIETRYKLGVSLFERMVNNDIKCYTLNVQHRMRPEISSLITPSIYPELYNGSSVQNLPQVRGMEKSLYFLHHTNPEDNSGDTSKKNIHEAKFLIQLAIYLLNNQYEPEEITILAAYLGQVGALVKEQTYSLDDRVKNIKITSVDDFQGEENKIILLSLVRNNEKGIIGFLSIQNRVCVALSRAKEGLYIMGNMKQLVKTKLWTQIHASLKSQQSVGISLRLKCQRHGQITNVKYAEDFDKLSPNGGCNQECKTKLKCGHFCKNICHGNDYDHKNYVCKEPCNMSSHQDQPCGNCMEKLQRKLSCGHHVRCFMAKLENYRCVKNVYVQLLCGHKQKVACRDYQDKDFKEYKLDCLDCNITKSDKNNNGATNTNKSVFSSLQKRLKNIRVNNNEGDSDDSENTDFEVKLPEKPKNQKVFQPSNEVEDKEFLEEEVDKDDTFFDLLEVFEP